MFKSNIFLLSYNYQENVQRFILFIALKVVSIIILIIRKYRDLTLVEFCKVFDMQ